MTALLNTTISHPLEREYEAWLAAEIEDYFEELRVPSSVWAISPWDETTWPADLGVRFPAKLVGLQVKRPTIAPASTGGGKVTFDRIKWSLANPKGQSALVAAFPEIYYCLPTFINRLHRRHALMHSIFWRPNGVPPSQIWYENHNAHTSPSVSHEMRWGRFVEQVVGCHIGYRAGNAELLAQFFQRLKHTVKESTDNLRIEPEGHGAGASYTTVFLAIEV